MTCINSVLNCCSPASCADNFCSVSHSAHRALIQNPKILYSSHPSVVSSSECLSRAFVIYQHTVSSRVDTRPLGSTVSPGTTWRVGPLLLRMGAVRLQLRGESTRLLYHLEDCSHKSDNKRTALSDERQLLR